MRKNLLSLPILFCAALSLMSCSSNDSTQDDPISITVSPEVLNIAYNETDAKEVTVTCSKDWSVMDYPSWCTPSKSGGVAGVDKVSFTFKTNDNIEAREGTITFKSGTVKKSITVSQSCPDLVTVSPTEMAIGGQAQTVLLTVSSNTTWSIQSSEPWCTVSPVNGGSGTFSVAVAVTENTTDVNRDAVLTLQPSMKTVTITQLSDKIITPNGYELVWNEEFNEARQSNGKPSMLGSKWWYETGNGGWGNNEIQNYVAGSSGSDTTALIKDGMLNIIAKKAGSQVLSARANTSDAWTYGYFEMRAKLPKGVGTWPAFWMMPKNYTSWPGDGEIDIMEGYYPSRVSSAVHCSAYYGGSCKTAATTAYQDVHDAFHVYALEWTASYIKTYVDGNLLFTYTNDGRGDASTWPFNAPFYLKLNLAWGGNWYGGKYDEAALPATYQIDYVRVFQKK